MKKEAERAFLVTQQSQINVLILGLWLGVVHDKTNKVPVPMEITF